MKLWIFVSGMAAGLIYLLVSIVNKIGLLDFALYGFIILTILLSIRLYVYARRSPYG